MLKKNEDIEAAGAKTAGGSWLDWRDAWRAMGRSEADIAAEDARREPAPPPPRTPSANASATRRRRERLHGFTRARFDARCERCARLSAYIVKALLRGWRRDPLTPRELFRAAWAACFGGERLASEGMARAWRDTWDWVRNIYVKIARERGIEAGAASESYSQSYSYEEAEESAENRAASDGVSARESKTKERPLKQCSPLTADAVCGLYGDFRRAAASPHSKGDAGDGGVGGRADAETERIPRFKGKLPGRCCWKVWEAMDELRALHWPATEHMWSAKHAFAWLASVMAAGKSLRPVPELYYETLVKWYGRRVAQEERFVPSGLFAELYRAATALPAYCPPPPPTRGDGSFPETAFGGDRGAKKVSSQRAGEAKTQNERRARAAREGGSDGRGI